MAYKFKTSAFKNTQAQVPKKDDTLHDLNIGQLGHTHNGIAVSSESIAFHMDAESE